ncbi:hypothetical protein MRX96_046281 [Rhipicephalus microplus]
MLFRRLLRRSRAASSLHHRVLLVECLKKWSRCDDSSINDSSSNDSSTDHDTNPAPAPGVDLGVGDGDAETSQRPDTESVLPSASEDEAGPPRRRRRLDDFLWPVSRSGEQFRDPGAHFQDPAALRTTTPWVKTTMTPTQFEGRLYPAGWTLTGRSSKSRFKIQILLFSTKFSVFFLVVCICTLCLLSCACE